MFIAFIAFFISVVITILITNITKVHIVFHCAATVRFDEDLTKSIGMNVSGVLSIVALAKKMSRLEVAKFWKKDPS